jgi:hypothetical protein
MSEMVTVYEIETGIFVKSQKSNYTVYMDKDGSIVESPDGKSFAINEATEIGVAPILAFPKLPENIKNKLI